MDISDLENNNLSAISSVCVAYNLRKASRKVTKFYQEKISASGLQGTQFPLLLAIKLNQSISITELSILLDIDRTTLSRNLKILKRKDLIVINGENEDNRFRNILLTDQGLSALETALPLWQEAQNAIVAQFGEEQWTEIRASLNKMTSLID